MRSRAALVRIGRRRVGNLVPPPRLGADPRRLGPGKRAAAASSALRRWAMTTYLVHRSDNATSAAQATRAFLESRPVEHNLILTLLRERIEHPEPGRYWWISESGQVRGV